VTRLSLGSYPTPVERLDGLSSASSSLWVKHDDRTGALYGGNKVRKLELLLGAARDEGKRRVLTVGAAGSHQVVATALYGEQQGLEVEAILVSQPRSSHAELNLRTAVAHGLRVTPVPARVLLPAYIAARKNAETYYVPLGASNPLGSLGFVDAARELAAQITRGEMPEPDVIVVALGSGGTAAGLAVGLEEVGLRTRVVAVAVSHPGPVLGVMARRLARGTAALAGVTRADRAAARIEVERGFIGRGYGHPSRDGGAATSDAKEAGIVLDPTYTAKAFACALARVRAGTDGTVLYWHTLSTRPLGELAGDAPLPANLARLLT
jgi:D-cysteine desulfhydrase